MLPKISICVFIKNNNAGAFCLWESMATLMPLADEFLVLDVGSSDGTFETLKDLATKQPKLRVERGEFPINPVTSLVDAGSFAEVANQMISTMRNDLVMYYQADEIWHERLLDILVQRLETYNPEGFKGLSFWRYQLADNFQKVKWFPHLVHRIGHKDNFVFVDDGMNTGRQHDAEIVGDFDGGWFMRWSRVFEPYPFDLPTYQMVMDVSNMGGFLENIRTKAAFHAPMWRSDPKAVNVGGKFFNADAWHQEQLSNPDWTKPESPFNIPAIMRPLVGQTTYPGLREDIKNKIING